MLPAASLIVDLAGYVTGIALYLMLALMVVRERVRDGRPWLWRSGRLPLITGLCGFVWNLGALIVRLSSAAGHPQPMPFVVATAFAALGFLPALVVRALSAQEPRDGRQHPCRPLDGGRVLWPQRDSRRSPLLEAARVAASCPSHAGL